MFRGLFVCFLILVNFYWTPEVVAVDDLTDAFNAPKTNDLQRSTRSSDCANVNFIYNNINNNLGGGNQGSTDNNVNPIVRNLTINQILTDIRLPCDYKTKTEWSFIDNIFYCDLARNIDTGRANPNIIGIDDVSLGSKSHSDVKGFRVYNKQISYFPRGLDNYFSHLEMIAFWSTGLIEVTQADLKPFSDLQYFSCWDNLLYRLEKDLFKFNPRLKVITLGHNRLRFIDSTVFSQLNYLKTLYLEQNRCIEDTAHNDNAKMKALIKKISEKC